MTKEQMQAALEAAIAKHHNPDVPGTWSVAADDNSIQLIWSCEESAAPEMYGDEPWSEWGGDEIIESAVVGIQTDAGCDQYESRGSTILEQWAQWKICEEN